MSTEETNKQVIPDSQTDLQEQQKYVENLEQSGFDFSLAITDTFINSIRDIGYKSIGTALDEEIDNSLQAAAKNIHVFFGYKKENTSQKKPDMIAIADDGHGMIPEMIRAAVVWGGTHRAESRSGFGRFGFGLPSSCVSQGRRFTVYSRVEKGQWQSVSVDIDVMAEEFRLNHKMRVPEPIPTDLPEWVRVYHEKQSSTFVDNFSHGTVVVIDKLDKVYYSTKKTLLDYLLRHFGMYYRNYLRYFNLFVDGIQVEPIDPLFLTPGARFYDRYPFRRDGKEETIIDPDRAEPLPPCEFDVKDKTTGKPIGTVKVRYSYLPPTFARIPENKLQVRGSANVRWQILKENNGFIVLRTGRQIDVVRPPHEITTLQNNDAYLKVEIDFPATLDEEFSITTSKQQITISERMWDLLKNAGVFNAFNEMRIKSKRHREELAAKAVAQEKRLSEQAMEDADKFRRPFEPNEDRLKEGDTRLKFKAGQKAEEEGRDSKLVQKELELETKSRPYKIAFEAIPGGPFYRPEQLGGQLVVHLNTAHPFFSHIYGSRGIRRNSQDIIEILLFVLANSELSAKGDIRRLYESERDEWSKRLSTALDSLDKWNNRDDDEEAANEMETSATALKPEDPSPSAE